MDKTALSIAIKKVGFDLLFGLKNMTSYVRIIIDYRNLLESSDKMHFSKKLYISPSLEQKCGTIKWKLRTGRPQPAIYLIALAKNNDLLEIYHSGMLKQKYYKKKQNLPFIVGIASGYGGAVDLVIDIIQDVLRETGTYDVKTYFTK